MGDINRQLVKGRIAVIILNYNNYSDTVECVDGILDADFLDIVLVDNLSPDGSGDRLRNRYASNSNVTYIQSCENRGYAAGNNVGIKFALNSLYDEYVCILNNDTLPKIEMFPALVGCLSDDPSRGIVGPVILDDKPGNIIQSAGADIHFIEGGVPARHSGERYQTSNFVDECAYISGACMMFRAKDAEKLGPIPECYFLFFEETEWCIRANRSGFKVSCAWDCSLVHKGSASISAQRGLGSYLSVRSRALFARRNEPPLQLLLFKLFQTIDVYWRHLVKREDCLWELGALRDGFEDLVDPEFEYIRNLAGSRLNSCAKVGDYWE